MLKKIANEDDLFNIGLSKKVINSGFWSFSSKISMRIFSFIKIIIISQILSPGDFGLLGVALLTLSIFEIFSKVGFRESLIQKKDNSEKYFNTVWTLLFIRGLLLFTLIFLFSPLISYFFSESKLILIIQTLSLVLIFRGLTNIGVVLFQKELDFKRSFILDLSRIIPDFIVSIILIFILNNIWALIIGTIAGEISLLIASYLIHPFKPRLEMKRENLSGVLKFGSWILLSNILIFLITQGDDIFVGKVLGLASLGYYQMAYNIGNIGWTEVANVFNSVTFPAYSKLQNNLNHLKKVFNMTLLINSFISFLLAGFIITFSENFIQLLLGEKWLPILGPLNILACWGTIRSLVACMSPVFYALNKPEIVTKYQIILAILIFSLIYPLTIFYNILGTALSIFISGLILFVFRIKTLINTIKIDPSHTFKVLFIPFIITLCLSLLFIYLKSFFEIDLILLIIIASFYLISYTFLSFIFDKMYKFNLFKFLFVLLRKK